jgi:hypothetical protein
MIMFADDVALRLPAIIDLKINVAHIGLMTNTVLRNLLREAICPKLCIMTLVLIPAFIDSNSDDHAQRFEGDAIIFHPFTPLSAVQQQLATPELWTNPQAYILSEDMMRDLEELHIIIKPRPSHEQNVIVHDTANFLGMFGRSRADAALILRTKLCRHHINFMS